MSFGCIFEFFSYISHLLGSTGDILFYFLIFFLCGYTTRSLVGGLNYM